MEINYVDSEGEIHVIDSERGNMKGFRIFILSDCKIVIGYQASNDESFKYCSWGYEKSSATTEKLSAFFKTPDVTWFIYLDAKHPEHTIFLKGEREEKWDGVQNVYNLIKSLIVEKRKDTADENVL